MNVRPFLVATVAISLVSLTAAAASWPQWRGPERNGISQEENLLQEWPAEGPKLLWRVEGIGQGYSTPAVVGERLYLLSNQGMEDEFVQARSTANGEQLWSTRIGQVGPNENPPYPGARSTPTVDGDLLYALGSDGDLACLETDTGKIRWKKNLRETFGGQPGKWAYAESPLIDGDMLICTPGGSQATIVALNKLTGEPIWTCAAPGGDKAGYASPIVFEVDGSRQYVQFLENGVVGVDTKTGELLWRYERTAQESAANIPTPVAHNGYIYSAAGQTGGGLAKVKAENGGFTAEQVYFASNLPKSIGGVVRLGDFIYGTNSQSLMCVEFLTGTIKWQNRGLGAASLCYADNRLYLHGENGEMALVEATPEEYREKGRFTPPGQPDRSGRAWTYPVVADGRLYIRDWDVLWCYDVRASGADQ